MASALHTHSEFSGLGVPMAPMALRNIQNIDLPLKKSLGTKKPNRSCLMRSKSAPSTCIVNNKTSSSSTHVSSSRKQMPRYVETKKPPVAAKKTNIRAKPSFDVSFWNEGWVDATTATAAAIDGLQNDIEQAWHTVIDDICNINSALTHIFSGDCEIPPPSLKDIDDEELFGLQFVEEEEEDIMAFQYSHEALEVDEKLIQEFAARASKQ